MVTSSSVPYVKVDGHRGRMADPELGSNISSKPSSPITKRTTTSRLTLIVIISPLFIIIATIAIVNYILPSSSCSNRFNRNYSPPISSLSHSAFFDHAAVASEVPQCSDIGKKLLQMGGSAVDAAIGAALCVGSINSFASGIGGGGFMLIRPPSNHNKNAEVIDFREVAPQNISEPMFKKNPELAKFGGLAVAVPGELRGFELAHQKYGKLPWYQIFEPIIALNKEGFRVSSTLAKKLSINADWITSSPTWSTVFAPNGALVKEGDTIYRPQFAETLRRIANEGARAFYEGDIAQSIVDTVQATGGTLTLNDLAKYQTIIREPAETWYRGRRILTAGVPAGGHVLAFMLNILERFPFNVNGPSALNYHRLVEAMRFGFARRSELGDPQFLDINDRLTQILSKQEAAMTRRNMSDVNSYAPDHYLPLFHNAPSHGTTHISVIDSDGMAVALTSTVNLYFGSHLMDPKFGIILNNQIDDFSFKWPNYFGLPASTSNMIAPLKRPMSSTCPTIIEEDGEVKLVVGASGGSRILTAVLQIIINYIDFGWPISQAVSSPRLHDQLLPNYVEVEEFFPSTLVDELSGRNHTIKLLGSDVHESVVQAVGRAPEPSSHVWEAVSDFRKGGEPAGY